MTEADVKTQVHHAILSILKRDGTLPPNAYLWAEVHSRLATLKPWEGMKPKESIGRALRPIVEAAALNLRPVSKPEEPTSPQHLPPFEAAKALGTKKHKHLKGQYDDISRGSHSAKDDSGRTAHRHRVSGGVD